jgi:hypothetical protein
LSRFFPSYRSHLIGMRLQTPMCGHLAQPPGRLVSHDLAIIFQASHKSFSPKLIKCVHAVGTAPMDTGESKMVGNGTVWVSVNGEEFVVDVVVILVGLAQPLPLILPVPVVFLGLSKGLQGSPTLPAIFFFSKGRWDRGELQYRRCSIRL